MLHADSDLRNRSGESAVPVLNSLAVVPVPLDAVLAMRDEYRRDMNCQIVHDSWHVRNYAQQYLLSVNGETVGYGSVGSPRDERDIVKEFFLRPQFRELALPLFRQLVATSGAKRIETQTNDRLLSLMFFDCATDWSSEWILFADLQTTSLVAPEGVRFRSLSEADQERVFEHQVEPVGNWGLELDTEIVATGGVLFHYNPPYGDLFMEVAEPFHRRGLGSYLVQELKRVCYTSGHLPGARCFDSNLGSRGALQRAGMLPCGRILTGRLAPAGDDALLPNPAKSE
jgi:GNAT superfamily N-acetyltransferase